MFPLSLTIVVGHHRIQLLVHHGPPHRLSAVHRAQLGEHGVNLGGNRTDSGLHSVDAASYSGIRAISLFSTCKINPRPKPF